MWILPSLAGMLWMLQLSSGWLELVTAVVYGLSLFLLFVVSTAFHTLAYCGDRFQYVTVMYLTSVKLLFVDIVLK